MGWGTGCPDITLNNLKAKGFLGNTGLDPLKTTKLPRQHLMSGRHRWWDDAGPLLVVFGSFLPSSTKKMSIF